MSPFYFSVFAASDSTARGGRWCNQCRRSYWRGEDAFDAGDCGATCVHSCRGARHFGNNNWNIANLDGGHRSSGNRNRFSVKPVATSLDDIQARYLGRRGRLPTSERAVLYVQRAHS